jgi:predicted DCC family thiol-disulfide oxidoreductase YuxK
MGPDSPVAVSVPCGSHILFYDGVCRFCNGLVQLGLHHDRAGHWRFAPLQGDFARDSLAQYGVDTADIDRIYAIADYGTPHQRLLQSSSAGAFFWRTLGFPPRVVGWLLTAAPPFIREPLYALIARHRYRLFGRYDTCKLPTPAQQARFIL